MATGTELSADKVPGGLRFTPDGTPAILSLRTILGGPLPHLAGRWLTRGLLRAAVVATQPWLLELRYLDRISPQADPFILALNHSQKLESLTVPARLIFHRQGKLIHFVSDWNFRMVPLLGLILRRAETISLANKPARPRFLNAFKPWFTPPGSGFSRAQQLLLDGRSIGIFPEGTVNRDPRQLLPGRTGAAILSLTTGVPVIPAGIRFPDGPATGTIKESMRLSLEIGEPLRPSRRILEPSREAVRQWHALIMEEIARLSLKPWQPKRKRNTYAPQQHNSRSANGHGDDPS